jgi:two-component system response regulator DesR
LSALRRVAAGASVVDPEHPRRPAGQASLSPREREVLRLAAAGATNQEISTALELGTETVKTLLSRAFVKLGARNRTEAVTIAKERGFL